MLELLKKAGGKEEDFDWFLSFYKNNKANLHSGCGIGFNRVTQSLLMLDDIRACTVFPQNSEVYW
jgi:aspartyl/asparaginyl-tRNA synthetase